MGANRLLIMDDESEAREYVAEVARDLGFDVRAIPDSAVLVGEARKFCPTVIALNMRLPEQKSMDVLQALSQMRANAKVLITSDLDEEMLSTTEELGLAMGIDIAGSLQRPISFDQLEIQLVKLLVEEKELTAEQLAEAIDSGQLVVHYQPKVALRDGGRWILDGAEALVRWQHDDYGLIYPNEFLDLAEENGLMAGLTDFVFRAAMEQARVWVANGLQMEVAINLSAQFLKDLEFPDRVLTLVRENNLKPSALTLELSETAAIENPGLAMEILARLRANEVNVCLDDFGTGSSSLTQLYRMPFSELKIDTSIISEMTRNDNAKAMVEGLIYLAHKLGMKACAEGVENAATLTMLEGMGCDKAQGHHVSQPVRPRELESLVEEWNREAADAPVSEAV